MIGLRIEAAKRQFFDRQAVLDPMERKTRGAMARFGAIVMREARKSLKPGKEPGAPGQPPHTHVFANVQKANRKGVVKASKRYKFRDSVLFVYDPDTRGVIIGPILFNGARTRPTVPELMEKGGTLPGKGRAKRYRPHPFMRPAFEKNLSKAPGLWAGPLR